MKKFLYFRNVEDEDNDDGIDASGTGNQYLTSLLVPVDRIRGITPASDTSIKISFDSVRNHGPLGKGASNTEAEVVTADHCIITVIEGDFEEVFRALARAIYSNEISKVSSGIIVIADDVTTNFAGDIIQAKVFHPSITGMAADSIVVAEANA